MSASSEICIESYLIFAFLTLQQLEVNYSELYLTQAQMVFSWMSMAQVVVNEPIIVFWNIVGCWPVQLRKKKTIVLHIHYEMSCQIAVVLWKRSFLGFREWRPGFQLRVLWCCYCFICRTRSGFTLYWRISGNQQMDECSIFDIETLTWFFFPLQQRQKANMKC